MHSLSFVATNDNARKLNDHFAESGSHKMSLRDQKIEYISLQVIREICEEFHVNFSVLGIADFLKIEQRGVTLLLDADIEPILYGDIFEKRIAVDGSEVSKCIDDKMSVYRLLLQSSKIKQPQTEPIHNHKDLSEALSRIPSQLVVIKPRSGGHSSRNVLINDVPRGKPTRYLRSDHVNRACCSGSSRCSCV